MTDFLDIFHGGFSFNAPELEGQELSGYRLKTLDKRDVGHRIDFTLNGVVSSTVLYPSAGMTGSFDVMISQPLSHMSLGFSSPNSTNGTINVSYYLGSGALLRTDQVTLNFQGLGLSFIDTQGENMITRVTIEPGTPGLQYGITSGAISMDNSVQWTSGAERMAPLVGDTRWKGDKIYFSFMTDQSNLDGYAGLGRVEDRIMASKGELSADQKQAFFLAMDEFSHVSAVQWGFNPDDTTDPGQIRVGAANLPRNKLPAISSAPGMEGIAGDILISNKFADVMNADQIRQLKAVFMGELGDAIGLKDVTRNLPNPSHPGIDGARHIEYSVVDEQGAYKLGYEASTLSIYDIWAIQSLYGPNWSYHGDSDKYYFEPGQKILQTIWDGVGFDEIYLTGCSIDLTFSLEPGALNVLSDSQLYPVIDANGVERTADYSVGIAFAPNGSHRALIEYLYSGSGNDHLRGNFGNNRIVGGRGDDEIIGGDGVDFLNGGKDDDTLFGDDNKDYQKSSSNDTLKGGDGNDTLYGGAGENRLFGGRGADTFRELEPDIGRFNTYVYESEFDSNSFAYDIIESFAPKDVIDLHQVLGGAGTFIGTAGFSGDHQVRYTIVNGNAIVYVNIEGNRHDEMRIKILDQLSLSADDFFF